jgi:site-specific DNA recombinase
MQKDNFSIDAQKRAITEAAKIRGLPQPVFYEDDERSARGEQIAKRPNFKRLLDDVEANKGRMVVMVHTLDRWSRNVMVTLQSFRILSQNQTPFISLNENIDYSTPEGMLQLTILAAFAAYFSDMLAKHTSKGKGERAAQGLYNGDVPFGYHWTGPKTPPEHNPETFPGLRMLGELRMKGFTADEIADKLNQAGYRTGSKRFGERLFTSDTVTAMLRTEFYAAFAPDDDRGTVRYHEQRHRGLHQAAFTYDEFYVEMAAVELALHQLQTPEVNGVKFDDVIAAGEHIPGMAALWDEATSEERREMVMLLLEPGGLYYDLELKIIAALKPRPAFLPILRMLTGVVEYDEAKGILVTENWQDRNRRDSNPRSSA